MSSLSGYDDGPPVWSESPADLVGTTLGLSMLVANDTAAAHLSHLVAYPMGIEFAVRLLARRRGQDEAEWDRIANLRRIRWEDVPRPAVNRPSPGRARASVVGADGFEAAEFLPREDDLDELDPALVDEEPGTPTLVRATSEGECGRSDMRIDAVFWLCPLPPPEPFVFRVEWPDVDLVASFDLDGAAVARAAGQARPAWPSS